MIIAQPTEFGYGRTKNIVKKRENAFNKHFLFFPYCIQKLVSSDQRVENIMRKEENARHQHFLLFTQYFQKVSISWSQNQGLFGNEMN